MSLALAAVSAVVPSTLGGTEAEAIYAGEDADISEFPWMVHLRLQSPDAGTFYCGGTLVNPYWVLTAAHCVYLKNDDGSLVRLATPGELDVVVGKNPTTPAVWNENDYVDVSHVELPTDPSGARLYENATSYRNQYDVALLELAEPVQVEPVQLSYGEMPVGSALTGIGFGSTTDAVGVEGGTQPDHLQKIDNLLVQADAKCWDDPASSGYDDIAEPNDNGSLAAAQICTKQRDDGITLGGPRFGDSGGPLLLWTNGQWLQLGIASHLPRACVQGECGFWGWTELPGVTDGDPNFTGWLSVANYRDWIVDITTALTILPVPSESLVVQELSYYALDLDYAGPLEAVTWSVASGVLPADVELDPSTGVISGYPVGAGAYPLVVQAETASGQTAQRPITITVEEIGPCTILFVKSPFASPSAVSLASADNWRPARVPNASDVACIDGGDVVNAVVDADLEVGRILVRRLPQFKIQPGVTLTAGGDQLFELALGGTSAPELIVAGTLSTSDAGVDLPEFTLLGGTLSGSGSFVVPVGSELESRSGSVRSVLVNRGVVRLSCSLLGFGIARPSNLYVSELVTNEGLLAACRSGSGIFVLDGSVDALLVNAAGGNIDPVNSMVLSVPTVNEGTITIGAGDRLVLRAVSSGGVWTGAGQLTIGPGARLTLAASQSLPTGGLGVGGGELAVESGAVVTLAGEVTNLSGSLSGSGSFVVPAGSVLESAGGDVRARLTNRGTLRTACGTNRDLYVSELVTNEGLLTACGLGSGIYSLTSGAGLVNAAGGNIDPATGSTLTLNVPTVNEGTITIGAGSVRFDSGLEMAPTSQVEVSVGPSFGAAMPVSGGVLVDGELAVITEPGFEPAVGTTEALGSWQGGVTGWWAAVSGGVPGLGRTWVPSVSADQFRLTAKPAVIPVADFDGDGTSDRSVFRPAVGGWYVDGQSTSFLGLAGDVPVPGDYDADGVTERAVFRDGAWYIDGQATQFFGAAGDVAVPGDYDGDGDWEPAVFRDGAWYIDGQATQFFGLAGDVPVPGDYDGDGATDIAVFRPSVGGWYVEGVAPVFYGLSTDMPVPADYDGDGMTDRAVFRVEVGGWYVDGLTTQFVGLSNDVPVPADYDGDGLADRAVYRPAVGGWYVDGQTTVFYGLGTDIPLPIPAAVYNTYYCTSAC